ncbi:DUF3710 domain-containing protein [Rhodococcus sp. 14C212]|uniref:DUF3710 domain-containing protein n=1 Tax=Rhodococcus sp. 14C212 TaxID=2711209 RepID=UPI0013EC6721|nr:DUF3710 domain-containing protein [Rhodococcus sp. 14C212]NGP04273.1 DUF3710 domain-containing protein [Rhodococcus sp. 14C212]
MFGRRRKNRDAEATGLADEGHFDPAPVDDEAQAPEGGPFDIDDIGEDAVGSRLDLGSVLVPLPPGGQIQVEMAPNGQPQAVHLVTQHGRITVSAYAAPKSPGQWREVAAELAESLRRDNATVSIESGPWGRELQGSTPNADLRFLGVDGYRWMIRCVVAGPAGSVTADSPLVETARAIVAETVVRRGQDPHPVRTPLPVVLPKALAEQLAAAQQQQAAAQQAAQQAPAQQPAQQQQPAPPRPRHGESGSAMQQLGF